MAIIGRKRESALLRDLVQGRKDLLTIGEEHKVPLEALADWGQDPLTRSRLAGLVGLADAQAQFVISRYRVMVAHRLAEHTQADQDERSRKACVDFLRATTWRPEPIDQGDPLDAEGGDDAAGE